MREVALESPADFEGWRDCARALIGAGVPPVEVAWQSDERTLFDPPPVPVGEAGPSFSVPARFVELARDVVCHRDPDRFGLLYRILWRVKHENARLLDDTLDPDVARVERLAKTVRREIHKMHAFVRFREVTTDDGPRYVAWFEPEHHVVEAAAPFFMRRFAGMRWSILTPERSVHWDGRELSFSSGAHRADAPADDALEEDWRAYYRSIFNPARLNVAQMRAEMPQRYWRNLPEAREIGQLIGAAPAREAAMIAAPPTAPILRRGYEASQAAQVGAGTLDGLKAAARGCQNCPLHAAATQTVFGEGPADAEVMLVGEQPGDQEDLEGRPFVGPAGQLLDRALAEAGLERGQLYLTNAVKHFKHLPRGKRRIHQKPDAGEIQRCRWWLEQERALVKPRLVVALGASAAQALLGRQVKVTTARGEIQPLDEASQLLITVHPSYLLRLPDPAARAAEYGRFVQDLQRVREASVTRAPAPSGAALTSAL
jgi:probable DNA metabolism protein